MKKIDTDSLEKMAKQKNIDKDKIEKIADNYKGKSESELMEELIKIGKNLDGREEVVSKFKAFLDDNQRKKLDTIMDKISDAETQRDTKPAKTTKTKKTKQPTKGKSNTPAPKNTPNNQQKKSKSIFKKTKKSNPHE
ncbi:MULTISPECIES: hypothetical protein [unclassified Clostridioides]|uniref:hypothetical protein n=1 Tax=unclassified Clostridioides TaxID=2635829 RepID=UPI001D1114CC|nr:hypothetical protein [Clostridioides sp. ZZV15-6388]MCC0644528.1 hypothetical protein [Clostridioides sp. ZZV14-6150]MCC0649898.1 hypothetical protein [Clostridioides sp. ZZV15-6598]MCC0659891.1 hypothetical protein [Clostridioides sp. ZZV14-6154]MCC0663008.1 hypothetical protein [Clostridioides sp. ZZV15-6597]MCC0666594.1 hypothetical protein [Clostridioides sp. ZZV14-6153]MCC0717616.1 hypothetical protein [Clostridioides sp. ZZV14-6105]MCC0722813.1 hypothetical protein [Clostridioides s